MKRESPVDYSYATKINIGGHDMGMTEKERLREIKEHVDLCPFGWHEGRVIVPRSMPEQEIIDWVAKLMELALNHGDNTRILG